MAAVEVKPLEEPVPVPAVPASEADVLKLLQVSSLLCLCCSQVPRLLEGNCGLCMAQQVQERCTASLKTQA